jgi:hypothetical protein
MLVNIFCNILDGSALDSRAVTKISPYLQLLNSIGQWQKSGVLSNKEDGLKDTALDDLCRLAGSAQCTLLHNKVFDINLFRQSLTLNVCAVSAPYH